MAFVQQSNFSNQPGEGDVTAGIFIYDDANPRAAIVNVFGEATFADAAVFESMIVGAIRIGRPVIIDFRECGYMDCATIGVLVRAAKNLRELLHIVLPSHSQGYRMLDLTGLVRALHIHESLESALSESKPVGTIRGI